MTCLNNLLKEKKIGVAVDATSEPIITSAQTPVAGLQAGSAAAGKPRSRIAGGIRDSAEVAADVSSVDLAAGNVSSMQET